MTRLHARSELEGKGTGLGGKGGACRGWFGALLGDEAPEGTGLLEAKC